MSLSWGISLCYHDNKVDVFRLQLNLKPKKKKPYISARLLEFGSPTWARTRDTRINSPLLYRLSYRGIGSTFEGVIILA
jgi:hypothetical protein